MNINHLNTISSNLAFDKEAHFHVYYWGETSNHRAHPLHKHSFFECCYVKEGEGIYHENGVNHPLRQGDCFLSRPDMWHRIESSVGIDLVWVAYRMEEEGASADLRGKYRRLKKTACIVVPSGTPTMTASLWQTLLNDETQEGSSRLLLEHIAFSLLLSFFSIFLEEKEHRRIPSQSQESITLHRARLFIQDNLSLRIKFQDLAGYLHISERHLSRLFKEEQGVSFSAYYRKVKIQAATALLESTDYTLEQISAATGFYSVHHFAKVFKQVTGTPPGQWRKIKTNSPEGGS